METIKLLSFGLKDSHSYKKLAVNVPIKNGMVVTSRFVPDSFLKLMEVNSLEIVSNMEHLSSLDEFTSDCQSQIDIINSNALDWRKEDAYLIALSHAINEHIERCGRIFFIDLTAYIDVYCHLMFAAGFQEDKIKQNYLLLIHLTVKKLKDKVKEGNPMVGIIPFSSTHVYVEIAKYVGENYGIE